MCEGGKYRMPCGVRKTRVKIVKKLNEKRSMHKVNSSQ